MLCISRLVLQCRVDLWFVKNCISLHACLLWFDTGQQEGSSCACRPWLATLHLASSGYSLAVFVCISVNAVCI